MEFGSVEIFQKYMGTGIIMIWFLAAICYLFVREKEKERRILFIYVPVIILLLFFNPVFFRFFSSVVESEIYFRICWLLPVIVVIAYAVICILDEPKGRKQLSFLIVSICLLAVSGKFVYSNPLYSRAQNEYHVPQAVVDICDAIKVPGREVMALFPPELVLYVRQYSPVVLMPYGRDSLNHMADEFYAAMSEEKMDLITLDPLVQEQHCHFIIFSEEKEILGDPQDFGWTEFDRIQGYVIYRNTGESLDIALEP